VPNENKHIAANLRRQRNAMGLTQADLASLAGVAQPRIAKLERGDGDPRISTVGRVAEALGISTASLLIPLDAEISQEVA